MNCSDYYYATYDFRDEIVGTSGTDIDFVDVDGTSGLCTSTIISEKNEHKKVLELDDQDVNGRSYIRNVISQTSGTIEFWVRSTDTGNRVDMVIGDGGTDDSVMIVINGLVNDKLEYYDGVWNEICDVADNIWYHIRIEFNIVDFDIWVNDVFEGGNLSVRGAPTLYDRFDIYTRIDDTEFTVYYDAIGYSWDFNYDIGDNKFPELNMTDILTPIFSLLFLIFLMILMIFIYMKVRIWLVILVLFLFSLIIGVYSLSLEYIPFNPYFSIFFMLFQSVIFLKRSLEVYKK